MKYLHLHKIVHRDLKTENILMDDLLCPKIADFGLSKMMSISENMPGLNLQSCSKVKGTPSYMAPEILNEEPCTKKGDVYAFSIIVYEIVTGKVPFSKIPYQQLIIQVLSGKRPQLTDDIPKHYRELIKKCWSHLPSERPSFDSIVEELKND